MKEYLYEVFLKDKAIGDEFSLCVWAENTDEATAKLCGTLIGPNCEYIWRGTSPVYQSNLQLEREKQG